MDRLFDRLGKLLGAGRKAGPGPAADPLLREAERELEEYLRTGRSNAGSGDRAPLPEALRRDFANLGLEPGACLEEVRRAHRRLLARYHPDRYARDPEKQRLATQIAQHLNASFRRILEFPRHPD